MEKENRTISVLQVIAIILVVIGHSFYGNQSCVIRVWIYYFHMPLFFFLSGYLCYYSLQNKHLYYQLSDYPTTLQHIGHKFKRLIIPYLVFPTLAFFPKVGMSSFTYRPIEGSWSDYIHMMLFPGDNVIRFYWFLPTLFLVFVLAEHVLYFTRKWTGRTAHQDLFLSVVCFLIPLFLHVYNPLKGVHVFYLEGVVYYLFYFAVGFYFSKYKFEALFQAHPALIGSITACLSIGLMWLPEVPAREVLLAINGIAMCWAWSEFYIQHRAHFLDPLMGSSYTIYLLSWFPQVFCQQVLMGLFSIPWQLASILAIITGLFIPYGCHLLVQKYKKTPVGKLASFLLGQ